MTVYFITGERRKSIAKCKQRNPRTLYYEIQPENKVGYCYRKSQI